jgi:uncharacterized protein YjbI with pentapeptide repeats
VSWQGLDLDFTGVVFDGGDFTDAQFSGGTVLFSLARFSGGEVDFSGAEFSGGQGGFIEAQFSGGMVLFGSAEFSGGDVHFDGAQFSGGEVDFSLAFGWSHPPTFDWQGTPPAGVKLPAAIADVSQ